MLKLPVVSGKDTIKKLEKIGYKIVREKSSHVRLKSLDILHKPITVPLHKTIKPGLLSQIIKDAGLSVDEFIDL